MFDTNEEPTEVLDGTGFEEDDCIYRICGYDCDRDHFFAVLSQEPRCDYRVFGPGWELRGNAEGECVFADKYFRGSVKHKGKYAKELKHNR